MEDMYNKGYESMQPDVISYTSAIDCLEKGKDTESGQRSIVPFRHMQDMYVMGNEDVKPDYITYNVVLAALANCRAEGSVKRAEEILNEMENSDDPDIAPNTVSYSTKYPSMDNNNTPTSLPEIVELHVVGFLGNVNR